MEISQHVINRYDTMFLEGRTPWIRAEIPNPVKLFSELVLKKGNSQKVLDVGCGNGWISIYLAQHGMKIEGIDSSRSAIQQAKRLAEKKKVFDNLHFSVGNALEFPFKANTFDAVFDRGMFHHQPQKNWPLYKKGLLRVLRSGGLYYLGVFSNSSSKNGFSPKMARRMWQKAKDSNRFWFYDHYFDNKIIKRIFESHFSIISAIKDKIPSKDGSLLLNCILRKK